MLDLFESLSVDTPNQMRGIFASIFIIQNRLQTAGEKIQSEISMKQWLLLAMVKFCPQPRTLTNIGNLMGCSRQNVKKLALTLENKGYIQLVHGKKSSICIELTNKANIYSTKMAEKHSQTLKLLFADFNSDEIEQLFNLYVKLYSGITRVENFTKGLN